MVKDCAYWNPSPSAVTVALQVHSLHKHTHASSLAHIQELRMHRAHRIQPKASQKCDKMYKGVGRTAKGENKGRW